MADRIGVCAQCGTKYKIPPSFQGERAKCKKCGGIVEIRSESGATAARPKDAPSARPAAARPSGRRPSSARARGAHAAKAGARRRGAEAREGSSRRAGTRRAGGRRGAARQSEDKTKLYVGIGAGALALIVAGFFLFGGGSDGEESGGSPEPETAAPEASTGSDAEAPEEAAALEQEAASEPAEEESEAPEAESTPAETETPAEPEPEPAPEESVSPVLQFEPFGPMPDTDEATWEKIQQAVRTVYLENPSRKRYREAKRVLEEAGIAQLPALLNALNGLDLSNDQDFVRMTNLVLAIQDVTHEVLKIPVETDVLKKDDALARNIKVLRSLIDLWAKKEQDPDAVRAFAQKVADRAGEENEDG